MLRDYQSDAVQESITWIRKSLEPFCATLATGAGKSHVLAAIAEWFYKHTGKKVLVLGPNRDIVTQNREKYLATGNPASMFSASAGPKDLKHPVIFGSPLTVINAMHRFNDIGLVLIDETHILTETVKSIVEQLRVKNPKLRVGGVSASPYRMMTGYIYGHHYKTGYLDETEAIDPYYTSCVYEISPHDLIARGFLTPPTTIATADHYDTSGLEVDNKGQYTQDSLDKAFTGHGRKTALIIQDVVNKSRDRKCVMLFASTRKHAAEIMASLPKELSALVTGETKPTERKRIINAAKLGKLKYLVSIGALTTGVDVPIVDVIALLRSTESVSLLQQIVGRGLRLADDKLDCLVLDYAENIENHCPHGDIFSPEIKTRKKAESEPIDVVCPLCSHHNEFSARPNLDGFGYSDDGYFLDLAGEKLEHEGQPLPSHFGRRCTGAILTGGELDRCSYKWSFKECPECEHENDIAARFCTKCRCEIVDPNEKLKVEHAKLAKDPYAVKFAPVESITYELHQSAKAQMIKATFVLEDKKINEFLHPEGTKWLKDKWSKVSEKAFGRVIKTNKQVIEYAYTSKTPKEIAYRKNRDTKHNEVVAIEW